MNKAKILVTGATGATGRATVDELLERGYAVRALAHGKDERSAKLEARGVEVVHGDLLDFGSVRAALDGVRRAYFAQAAKEAGIEGIVNMSQISAREDAKSNAATDHWLSERVFDWSGLAVAHIRPTYFAEWLLYMAPMIKAGHLHVPFGTGKHAPIAAEDQGRVIAGILEDPARHAGKVYPLFGAKELTYAETADVLGRVLGKPIDYRQIDFDTFVAPRADAPKHPAKGFPPSNPFLVQHLREVVIDHQNGIFAGTNDLVQELGGRPPTTLETFIEKHRAAFA